MYYIKLIMKNTILKLLEYIYYFSLVILLILYLFPGSLIGYFLYGNLGQQPNLIPNPIGTSINHLIFFSYITTLALIVRSKAINIFTNYIGNFAMKPFRTLPYIQNKHIIIDLKSTYFLNFCRYTWNK